MGEFLSDKQPERTKTEEILLKNEKKVVPIAGKKSVVIVMGTWVFGFSRTETAWLLTVAELVTHWEKDKMKSKYFPRIENAPIDRETDIEFGDCEGFLSHIPEGAFPEEIFRIRFGKDDVQITLLCDLFSKLILR